MIKQSVWSSAIAAKVASVHLKPGGVLQLTGAAAATGPTSGMIGYGLAKAAVHHLATSLAAEGSGLPQGSSVLTILPVTLDTAMNRKWMPKADHSTWTPLSFISESLLKWTTEVSSRPESGSLLKITTSGGNSVIDKQ
uniref:Dihydropteridine reductase n=1 Tax=Caenorhabditis japonica TaxID=281687 RepID=A0A8R1HVE4_CAEJA